MLDKNILSLIGSRFDNEKDFNGFMESGGARSFANVYNEKFEGGIGHSNEYLLNALTRAMQQFDPIAKIMLETAQIQEKLAREGLDIYAG